MAVSEMLVEESSMRVGALVILNRNRFTSDIVGIIIKLKTHQDVDNDSDGVEATIQWNEYPRPHRYWIHNLEVIG